MTWIMHARGALFGCLLLATSMTACSSGKDGAEGPAGAMGGMGAMGAAGAQGMKGPTGDPGPAHMTFIRKTIDTAGANLAGATTAVLGTWGPFTLTGYCYAVAGNAEVARAEFYLSSTDTAAKYTDYATDVQGGDVNPTTGPVLVEYPAATTVATTTDLEGPYDGQFAAWSSDLGTYIVGSLTDGVYMNGPTNSPCQFFGYVQQAP